MKHIVMGLAVLLSCIIGGASFAKVDGLDIKVRGQWDFSFGWVHNRNFEDSVHGNTGRHNQDSFEARQRIRTQINFITSEYLQAVLMFEIGGLDWGRTSDRNTGPQSGGSLDADGVNIKTKRAYIDWIIPQSSISVRMGIQGLTLPSTPMGSPLFDADVAGIMISSPIADWLSATAFWIRPFDPYQFSNDDHNTVYPNADDHFSDEVDIFGLILPMNGEGWSVTPWFMYGFIGANSGVYDYMYGTSVFTGNDKFQNTVGTDAYWSDGAENSSTHGLWLGAHLELTKFDPWVLNLEAIYGRLGRANLRGLGWFVGDELNRNWVGDCNIRTSGWFLGATLDYKLDFGTPGIFAWWASGDKANAYHDGSLGRLPAFGNDGGSFSATSFGMSGYYGIGNGGDSNLVTGTGLGTMGIGIQLADFSFIEDLSHTLRFAYYRGTNDPNVIKNGNDGWWPLKYSADALYLTKEDNVFEVNFDHKYRIYQNLEAVLELGYLRLHADKDTWSGRKDRMSGFHNQRNINYKEESENAWKAELNFRYEF